MQPFARPAARLVLGHARLGLDRAARQGTCGRGPQSTAMCAPCCVGGAIGVRGRYYSTQIPPKNSRLGSGPGRDGETEPDLIAQLRAEQSKRDDAKREGARRHEVQHEEADQIEPKPKESKVDDVKTGSVKRDAIKPEEPARSFELPSTTDSRRSELMQRFSAIMDKFQSRALNATQTLNDITGYTGIEAIKAQNAKLEDDLAAAHEHVRNARQAYKTSNTKRAVTQREVTTLLARKDTWSPYDLERFTELYRTDHVLEGEVATSQETLTEAEAEEQSLSQRLNAGILKRYHEEQIWSDRIRRASTWGTWGLMGMNFLLFVVLQFVAEPWKRRRLVRGVVAEEKAVLDEVRVQLEQVKLALERRDPAAAIEPVVEAVKVVEEAQAPAAEVTALPEAAPAAASMEPTAVIPAHIVVGTSETPVDMWQRRLEEAALQWRATAEDLFSERRIDLRMKDASLLALQGALAGAVFTGSIALLLVRRS
ncbi:Mdm33 family-domain-containing protein [Dactylonectria estremocensis]|uniref:Sensitive to high expression protein 9, mitochondrial n=1 Tax=Dactylonectria estremocensis TaxID=1079267 RepID=A0A9P9J6U1_9HYPO|nr:Mdm33 family-domain-containing protein [Dactylonectria estremocensis]